MYKLDATPYGFRLAIGEQVTLWEATRLLRDSSEALTNRNMPFGVLVDIRTLKPMHGRVQGVIDETLRLFRDDRGLERSAVVLASAIVTMQLKRIAKESGAYQYERYINTETHREWDHTALAWIIHGVDPDVHHA